MLVKFKIASFRETDRIQESSPVYLGGKAGITIGKVQKNRVWDYELTATDGKTYTAYGKHKRGGFRKGQIIMTYLNSNGRWIGPLLTLFEFNQKAARIIDRLKEEIKKDEVEIARIRAL